jgi:hypothetical protein
VLVDMALAWLKLAEQATSFHPKTYGHLTVVSDRPSRPHNPKRNCPGFDPKSRLVSVQMWSDLANQVAKNAQTDSARETPYIVPEPS